MAFDPNQPAPGRYSGWAKGMDNRRADFDLPVDVLRDAVNVDVHSSGQVKMRRGIVQVIPDANAHSVYSDGKRLVWATPNTLKMADANMDKITLLTDSRLANPLSYTLVNGEIYFSNEQINGKINALGAYEKWGIVPPSTQPTLSAVTGPYLFQVVVAFVTLSGEESGSGLPVQVMTTDPATIIVSNIPQSSDSRVVATRIYVTGPDGDVYFRNQDVPTGITNEILYGPFDNGMFLKNQFNANPPPGQLIEKHKGWIFIAIGNLLIHTDALRYGIYEDTASFFMFPERLTLLKAVPDGVYVSADKTYFLPNAGTEDVQQIPVLPYRAIEGAACHLPNSEDVAWMSERGLVRGSAGGQVVNLTEGQIAVDKFTRGCLGYAKNNGHQALVSIMTGATPNPMVSPDFVALDAIRKAEIV